MTPRPRRRPVAGPAAALGLVAVIAGLAVAPDPDDAVVPLPGDDVGAALGITDDELLVPTEIDGYQLTHVAPTGPRTDRPAPPSSLAALVSTFEGRTVTVSTTAATALVPPADAEPGAPGAGGAGGEVPADIRGRPVVRHTGSSSSYADMPWSSITWLATDDLAVTVASRDVLLDDLARLAEQVILDGRGDLVLPEPVIGSLPDRWGGPMPGVTAVYERRGDGGPARIRVDTYVATPAEQRGYLAVAAPDGSIDGTTHHSCCAEPIPPRRTVEVHGRDAVAVALSADSHVLILPGDPGAVLFIPGGRFNKLPGDQWLTRIAEALRPMSPGDLARRAVATATTTTTAPGGLGDCRRVPLPPGLPVDPSTRSTVSTAPVVERCLTDDGAVVFHPPPPPTPGPTGTGVTRVGATRGR